MNNNRQEARRWFDQGKHDHEAAKVNSGIPHEVFTEEDARRALEGLRQVIALVSSLLDFDGDPELEIGKEESEG